MSCFRTFCPGGCRALYLASKRKNCWHMILHQFHALELHRVAPPLDMMQLIGPRQEALEAFETTNYQPESICVYSICLPTNFAKLGSYRYWIPTEYPYISEFPSLSRRSLNFLSSPWCQRGIETEIVTSQGKFLTIKLTCSGCSRLHCLEIII